ncbi:hypothetical protein SY83_00170 [Paenibacillus swuensis]|uniref:DUF2515 domain-containing protein n=2 Tax=Paenibacillus swuensis TaxID=1178515 RepID=A0A172TNQ2_9BACL|nr:hypothetical protein SY83_00170 [Paenibacillus swuensis]
MPENVYHYLHGKAVSQEFSAELAQHPLTVAINPATLESVRKALKERLNSAVPSDPSHPLPSPTLHEQNMLDRIRQQTDRLNANNVTRTGAYLDMYRHLPELHWALLAHMVSRNGGWSMTDLKGELVPRLITPKQGEAIFRFLEYANNYIFQDAYPQLLLYAESLKLGKPLFHLLPQLRISAFMQPFWEAFWRTKDSGLLTVALIINEQHYIERRIVQQPDVQSNVLQSLQFQAQAFLQLNQVVFPYTTDPLLSRAPGAGAHLRLAGLVLEDFKDLAERINVGKALYTILFGFEDLLEGTRRYASAEPHTGSRADYWPHLFARIKKASPYTTYTERLDGCRLKPGAAPLYSPALRDAWPDTAIEPPEAFDWFDSLQALRFFKPLRAPHSFDMTNEYCFGLNKIELAVLAGEHLLDEK